MSFMARSGGERDENNYCLGMTGNSKNYSVICKQYLCDFYILESGILVLRCVLKFWRASLKVRSERSETWWLICLCVFLSFPIL